MEACNKWAGENPMAKGAEMKAMAVSDDDPTTIQSVMHDSRILEFPNSINLPDFSPSNVQFLSMCLLNHPSLHSLSTPNPIFITFPFFAPLLLQKCAKLLTVCFLSLGGGGGGY